VEISQEVLYVKSVVPYNNSVNVSIDTFLIICFSSDLNETSLDGAVILKDGTSTIPGSIKYSSGINTVEFIPDNPLDYNTKYSLTLTTGISNIEGTALDERQSYYFTTLIPPSDKPVVMSKSPLGKDVLVNTIISITFNREMNKESVEGSFSIIPNIEGNFSWTGQTLKFRPQTSLKHNTTYSITLNMDATDTEGNHLDKVYPWNFTTVTPQKETDDDDVGNDDDNDDQPVGPSDDDGGGDTPHTKTSFMEENRSLIVIAACIIVIIAVIVFLLILKKKRGKKDTPSEHEEQLEPAGDTPGGTPDGGEERPEVKSLSLDDTSGQTGSTGMHPAPASPDTIKTDAVQDIGQHPEAPPTEPPYPPELAPPISIGRPEQVPAGVPKCEKCGMDSTYYQEHDCCWCENCEDYVVSDESSDVPALPAYAPHSPPEPLPPPESAPEPAPSEIENVLPGYNFTEKIGAGGFATVYKATDKNGKLVAVKLPKFLDATVDATVLTKFEEEANIWRKLRHKNIVEYYEGGTMPLPHLIIELMEGGNLKKVMAERRFSMDESMKIILQVLDAISYAHRMATVHRDLKPENILFSKNGTLKLSDWGIGKFMASESTTRTMGTKGTLSYSSPEQISKKKFGAVDWQTDIFQMGIVFYEVLTGVNPFYDDDPIGIMGKITNEDPDPPSIINPEISPELDNIILGALRKRKEDRWRSADVMYDRLKELVK